jgi:N-acetylmuramoyl-L-alanine amidase
MVKKSLFVIPAAILSLVELTSIGAGKVNLQKASLPIIPYAIPEKLPEMYWKDDFMIKLQRSSTRGLISKLDTVYNFKTSDFKFDSPIILTARLMMGEAEGWKDIDKIACVYTALTRLKKGYGKTFQEVVLKPKQYSCFNEGTDSSKFLKDPMKHNAKDFLKDLELAREIWNGDIENPVPGATHYYNPKVVRPEWAKKMEYMRRVGPHVFYRDKKRIT